MAQAHLRYVRDLRPYADRPVFFRCLGPGLDDIALANALYHLRRPQ